MSASIWPLLACVEPDPLQGHTGRGDDIDDLGVDGGVELGFCDAIARPGTAAHPHQAACARRRFWVLLHRHGEVRQRTRSQPGGRRVAVSIQTVCSGFGIGGRRVSWGVGRWVMRERGARVARRVREGSEVVGAEGLEPPTYAL